MRAAILLIGLTTFVALGGCANRLPVERHAEPGVFAPTGGCTVTHTVTVRPRPGVSVSRGTRPAPATPPCPTALKPICLPDDACAGGRCRVPR